MFYYKYSKSHVDMIPIDETSILKDPVEQFTNWYSEVARGEKENYNAVALSTSAPDGVVSSRIVLLKDYSNDGFVFYTNYDSKKGRQIAENPNGAMLFYWPAFRRQVRVEGIIIKISSGESDSYFNSRIEGHKLNALASPQSTVISGRELLLKNLKEQKALYPDGAPPRPKNWGGFRLVPNMFEFWQEGADRFHDRFEYLESSLGWTIHRLAP
jgi:pyridoxamine-phosphate oxidase